MCLVLLWLEAAFALLTSPGLRVTHVRVQGRQTLSESDVLALARPPLGRNIFLTALRVPLVARLTANPVIEQASRKIEVPDTLVLTIRERQPYATLVQGDTLWLLDRHGVPYRALSAPQAGVPLLEMPYGTRPILGRPLRLPGLAPACSLIELLQHKKNLGVVEIKVDQNQNLCLNRKDKLQIRLGQPDGLQQKVTLAQATLVAYGGGIAQRAAYIDLSCPEQPVWMPRQDAGGRSGGKSKEGLRGTVSDLGSP